MSRQPAVSAHRATSSGHATHKQAPQASPSVHKARRSPSGGGDKGAPPPALEPPAPGAPPVPSDATPPSGGDVPLTGSEPLAALGTGLGPDPARDTSIDVVSRFSVDGPRPPPASMSTEPDPFDGASPMACTGSALPGHGGAAQPSDASSMPIMALHDTRATMVPMQPKPEALPGTFGDACLPRGSSRVALTSVIVLSMSTPSFVVPIRMLNTQFVGGA